MVHDIRDKVCELIVKVMKLDIEPASLKPDDLIHDYGISSVDALEILIGIEAQFNITIDDNDLSQQLVATIDNLVNYVTERMQYAQA